LNFNPPVSPFSKGDFEKKNPLRKEGIWEEKNTPILSGIGVRPQPGYGSDAANAC